MKSDRMFSKRSVWMSWSVEVDLDRSRTKTARSNNSPKLTLNKLSRSDKRFRSVHFPRLKFQIPFLPTISGGGVLGTKRAVPKSRRLASSAAIQSGVT